MAKPRSTFLCPNCFSQFQKDDTILMLSSGAAIAGEGIAWSGDLGRDLGKVKRVKYCKSCRKPLDFHALLRGRLDYQAWGPCAAVLVFLLALTFCWYWLDYSFWSSLALAVLAATAAGLAGAWLERKRLARWRLSDSQLAELTAP
jgi:hypothetical protein